MIVTSRPVMRPAQRTIRNRPTLDSAVKKEENHNPTRGSQDDMAKRPANPGSRKAMSRPKEVEVTSFIWDPLTNERRLLTELYLRALASAERYFASELQS
jgi:hypothetical protein